MSPARSKPADIDALVADRQERQRFWTAIMDDETEVMSVRLRASELLARSEGDFLEHVVHSGASGSFVLNLNTSRAAQLQPGRAGLQVVPAE